jgi:hypothetical protein
MNLKPKSTQWVDNTNSDEDNSQPIFEIHHIVQFKELNEEDQSLYSYLSIQFRYVEKL